MKPEHLQHHRKHLPGMIATLDADAPWGKLLLDLQDLHNTVEGAVFALVLEAFDKTLGDNAFDDIGWDSYDRSIEIRGAATDLIPTDAQWEKITALGFACGWVNYRDGSERAYPGGHYRERGGRAG